VTKPKTSRACALVMLGRGISVFELGIEVQGLGFREFQPWGLGFRVYSVFGRARVRLSRDAGREGVGFLASGLRFGIRSLGFGVLREVGV
jgi:hypothetical protein